MCVHLILNLCPRSAFLVCGLFCKGLDSNNNDNNNEILIKREPLVHTRARRAVQQKTSRTVQQQQQAHPWTVHQQQQAHPWTVQQQ